MDIPEKMTSVTVLVEGCVFRECIPHEGDNPSAHVVELVDTRDLKSLALTGVPVRVRPWAPKD